MRSNISRSACTARSMESRRQMTWLSRFEKWPRSWERGGNGNAKPDFGFGAGLYPSKENISTVTSGLSTRAAQNSTAARLSTSLDLLKFPLSAAEQNYAGDRDDCFRND